MQKENGAIFVVAMIGMLTLAGTAFAGGKQEARARASRGRRSSYRWC
ncbi:MAG: hypothetical protein IMZ69_06085 [Spirochaetes bacterium]|nr:hypothetical protein [Spirochaetota bacterium]